MRISDWSSDVCSSDLSSGGRLITAADFAAEAARSPQVARPHALPAFHPDVPALETSGPLTLLILPKSDAVPPPAPDKALLRAIIGNMELTLPCGLDLLRTQYAYGREGYRGLRNSGSRSVPCR